MTQRTGRYQFVLRLDLASRHLRAGDVVSLAAGQLICRFRQSSSYLVEDAGGGVGFVSGRALLPMEQLFRRQPPTNFWFLIRQEAFLAGRQDVFLGDPRTLSYGGSPFRFESLGELVHAMRSRLLRAEEHLVCSARRMRKVRDEDCP